MAKRKKTKKKDYKKDISKHFKKGKNKEIYIIIGAMIGIILLFIVSYYIFKHINEFEYNGLSFRKERFGELVVYHYSYYYQHEGELFRYNLFLRKDPRKNKVPVYGENIKYIDGKFVYITSDYGFLTQCDSSTLALAQLSSFLTNNQITPRSGTFVEDSNNTQLNYVTCESKPNNPVIVIKEGTETRIDIDEENMCYEISVANCEVLEAAEKFIVQSILDAKLSTYEELNN
mgnify:CR=1 FL=1